MSDPIQPCPLLPQALRAWRARQALSQSQAALELGVNRKTLQNWEQGSRSPRGLARKRLLELIGEPQHLSR
jgi:DNA-binding transcriptional regulator YiaG